MLPDPVRRARQRQMARRIIRVATGLRPSVVAPLRRQVERLIGIGEIVGDTLRRLHDGDTAARQRGRLFFEGIEVAEFRQGRAIAGTGR